MRAGQGHHHRLWPRFDGLLKSPRMQVPGGSNPSTSAGQKEFLTHPPACPLTTQIYSEGDRWIDSDVVGAVEARLITPVARSSSDGPGAQLACSYDFGLPAAT
jgi:hypothetical protein